MYEPLIIPTIPAGMNYVIFMVCMWLIEANIESHGMDIKPDQCLANQPEWEKAFIDRTERMFERDKPSLCHYLVIG